MSSSAAHQDASLSAASFLASISAESSTSFGSTGAASTAATSAPALPISAKVSLIDAQIDALEGRIEQTITSHTAQLRERAASTRSVDHDLNQLWRSVNQTSSRLVTVGPQLAPVAAEYHDALAQSSKQGLLISVLSDLLTATRHLERLEKLQHQSDLTTLRAELPQVAQVMQPFRTRSALQSLPAVLELQARFERLENKCKDVDADPDTDTASASASGSRSFDTSLVQTDIPKRNSLDKIAREQKEASSTSETQSLSPALTVLESARALIVARGPVGGWKEVRIELDAPAPPPSAAVPATVSAAQPSVDSNRSSLEARPERFLREDLGPESAPLTRNSSSSSATNARNRHKPKLGARLIRPQDQLGSGPFNAEDAALDEDGWGLDDDDDEAEATAPPQPATSIGTAHSSQSQTLPYGSQPAHPSVTALARDSRHSSPSSSVMMQSSMSSSSSQHSAFAVQEPEPGAGAASNDDVDAWGLGEDDGNAEDDAWDLDEGDAPQELPPPSPKKAETTISASAERIDAHVPPAAPATHDAWDLEDEEMDAGDDPWETEQQSEATPATPAALQELSAAQPGSSSLHAAALVPEPALSSNQGSLPPKAASPASPDAIDDSIDDPWETEDQTEAVPAPSAVPQAEDLPSKSADREAVAEPESGLTADERTSHVKAALASATNVESDPWETEEQADEADEAVLPASAPQVHDGTSSSASKGLDDTDIPPPVLAICPPHPGHADQWDADKHMEVPAAPPVAIEAHDAAPSSTSAPSPISTLHAVSGAGSSLQEAQSLPTTKLIDPSHDIAETEASHIEDVALPDQRATAPSQHASVDVNTSQANRSEAAPQQAVEPAEDSTELEPEEDAWGFEEGSSASEADRTEFAPITPLHETEVSEKPIETHSQAQPAHVESPKAVGAAETVKSIPEKVGGSEIVASPPSPTGWGQDFSDSESAGLPATQEVDRSMGSSKAQNNARSVSSSRSVSASSKARTSVAIKEAANMPEPVPEPSAVSKEKCTISQRSLDLVQLAESTMSSVISLLQGQARSGAESDDVEALAGAVFKIFELHRALMPVAHGEALRDVPSLAMQFFNDCEYLARELTRLVGDKGEAITAAWMSRDAEAAKRWKTKELVKLEQEAALTRGLGQRWFEAQMTAQTKILLDTLMEADGFARTFDEHRFARCERCIKQVVQTLQQLAKAWQPVLVASRFHAAMGRLVDLVFQKVLHDVLDLEDIGESESEKIASLVKTLGGLEGLFSAEGSEQSAAPLWVPSWFKTSYLIEILTGSLVDIEFLAFEAGALVDYSRKELTGLIKALFADTPNRSKLLRRIETAPVEVLAH